MHIVGVIVSVNYADFLVWSLPAAKHVFNKLVVVTSKDDAQTKKVCDHNYVQWIETDLMYKDGANFNKGMCINLGLEVAGWQEWAVHMDSDIVLPVHTSKVLRSRKWNHDIIYGADRLMIKSWEEWIRFYTNPFPQTYVGSVWPGFEVGYRVTQGGGYTPIGYFQMFHKNSKYMKKPYYPTDSNNAAESDLQLSFRYPVDNRQLIPDFFVYHLESEKAEIGKNWEGRETKRFGP